MRSTVHIPCIYRARCGRCLGSSQLASRDEATGAVRPAPAPSLNSGTTPPAPGPLPLPPAPRPPPPAPRPPPPAPCPPPPSPRPLPPASYPLPPTPVPRPPSSPTPHPLACLPLSPSAAELRRLPVLRVKRHCCLHQLPGLWPQRAGRLRAGEPCLGAYLGVPRGRRFQCTALQPPAHRAPP
jgi:hypothetical protein